MHTHSRTYTRTHTHTYTHMHTLNRCKLGPVGRAVLPPTCVREVGRGGTIGSRSKAGNGSRRKRASHSGGVNERQWRTCLSCGCVVSVWVWVGCICAWVWVGGGMGVRGEGVVFGCVLVCQCWSVTFCLDWISTHTLTCSHTHTS